MSGKGQSRKNQQEHQHGHPGAALFLWHGRALVIGPGIDSTPHAHFAVQITLGLDAPFRTRLGEDQPWIAAEAALFAPNQEHQLDCGGGMLAHLFVEVPPRQQTIGTTAPADFHLSPAFAEVRAVIDSARQGKLDLDAAEQAVQQWLKCALPQSPTQSGGVDARISRALEWIAANPDRQPSGALLASEVHLSESRFTHLFRQQTGLSLSRYLLWARLLNGVAAVARGESMTGAAHHAGFSDLAHMSRTFRHTFGVVPSELNKMTIAFKQNPV